jgi:DNA-binding transcriptional ArsR family regulator
VVAEKEDDPNDDFVKIYANTDSRMKELGQTLKTPKSRKIYQILMDKELHTKEIGMILENEENPRLPNLTHHLKKMTKIGLLTSTQKMKNGHELTYYKAVNYLIIVPQKDIEVAQKSKTLKTTLRKVFKISVITIPSITSYFFIKFLEDLRVQGTTHVSSQSTNLEFLVPLVIFGIGIGIERLHYFSHRRHSMNIE